MKRTIYTVLLLVLTSATVVAQEILTGIVVDSVTRMPLSAATVKIEGSDEVVLTNSNGEFKVVLQSEASKVTVSHVGYKTRHFPDINAGLSVFPLGQLENIMEEVIVSTGYQLIPKERMTGSFSFIDNKL